MQCRLSAVLLAIAAAAPVCAQTQTRPNTLVDVSANSDSVAMHLVDKQGVGKYLGNIEVRVTDYGLVFEPSLTSLPPGLHGFHVHENPSCELNEKDAEHRQVPAGAAGDHFDPKGVDTHGGPWGVGHQGDLPMLFVDQEGNANHPVLAPRMTMEFLKAKSLVLHANPDTYTDEPENGGSGPRIACGTTFSEALEGRPQD